MTPEDYLRLGFRRIVRPDPEGGFAAKILEFQGCFADGETAQEAYDNLEDAAADWIRAALRQGQSIPQPVGGDGYSGNIMLRLPRALHERAAELAEVDGTSLNQFLVSAIAERVGADDVLGRVIARLEQTQWHVNAVIFMSQETGLSARKVPIQIERSVTNTSASMLGMVPFSMETK
jgi:predicted RNase H-like HicB family nuclease